MAFRSIESHARPANGLQIHYLIAREGPPLVLLHGWPQHSHHWPSIIPALAARFLVIAPDQRGAGGSSKPREASYRKRDLAADIHALVRELVGSRRINLCGYDHGAGTAYQYAAQWPDEVEGVAFLEFPLPGFGYEEVMHPRPGWDHVWQLAAFTVPEVCERFFVGRERDLLAWYFSRGADNPNAVSMADFEIYVRTLQLPNALRAGMEYFAAIWDDAADNKAAARTKLDMPTLAIGGESAIGSNVQAWVSEVAQKR